MVGTIFKCRNNFVMEKELFAFHPGHMAKGMNKMQNKLARVDCFIETHDARIPFSGRNKAFYDRLTAIRPHILCFNKMDLADTQNKAEIRSLIMEGEPNLADVIWTDACIQYHQTVKAILGRVNKAIDEKAFHTLKKERNIMIIGVPNTGKSSLINALRRVHVRKGNVAPVANHAGVTRAVQERIKLLDHPPTYLVDTPGVTTPSVLDTETGMRLALCSTYKDSLIGEDNICDYLLYWLNKRSRFEYVNYFGLEKPTDDINVLLAQIARTHRLRIRRRSVGPGGGHITCLNFLDAAKHMLRQFRMGNLGLFMLDDDILEKKLRQRMTLIEDRSLERKLIA